MMMSEGHCAASTKGTRADFGGIDPSGMSAAVGSKTEVGGDVGGPNPDSSTIAIVGSKDDGAVNGGLAREEVGAVRENQTDGGANGAAQRVVASSVGDFVAFALIFLRREIEADRGCGFNFRKGSGGEVEVTSSEGQVNVAEGESGFVGGCAGIFARSEEKIEGQTNNISVCFDSG